MIELRFRQPLWRRLQYVSALLFAISNYSSLQAALKILSPMVYPTIAFAFDKEFNLFNTAFMEEISKMPEKNLSIELLKKLIAEQVRTYKRTNIVKSKQFSEMLDKIVKSYLNGLLTNEEVIAELMKMAQDIANAHQNGNAMGLTDEELAFYDALAQPRAVKDVYSNDQLIAITKELTEELRKSRTVDWEKKESARAGMRRMVKRLLKKFKYPPEGMEDAVQTVINQCEMWSGNQ